MRIAAIFVCLILAAAAVAPAQEAAQAAPSSTYRLNFVLHETEDGKPAATHACAMLVEDGSSGSIRTGTQVAVPSGGGFQYRDAGMRITSKLRSRDSQLLLTTTLEFSRLAGEGRVETRQTSTDSTALIPVGKPATIFAFDDWAAKRHYEVEVTAIRAK
jgi:hypothetical protein